MKCLNYLFVLIALLFGTQQLSAQQPKMSAEQREKIESAKIAFFTERLELTVDEATLFWPIYNQHQRERRAIDEKMHALNRLPDTMTEAAANDAIETLLTLEAEKVAQRKKFVQQLRTAIPATKIVRLPQVERAFRRALMKRLKKGRR